MDKEKSVVPRRNWFPLRNFALVNFPLIPTHFASIVMRGLKYSFNEEITNL